MKGVRRFDEVNIMPKKKSFLTIIFKNSFLSIHIFYFYIHIIVRYYDVKRIIKIHKFSNSIWHVSSRCPIDLKFYTGTQRKQIR